MLFCTTYDLLVLIINYLGFKINLFNTYFKYNVLLTLFVKIFLKEEQEKNTKGMVYNLFFAFL